MTKEIYPLFLIPEDLIKDNKFLNDCTRAVVQAIKDKDAVITGIQFEYIKQTNTWLMQVTGEVQSDG